MLIIKITVDGKETYHGCVEVAVDDNGGRRIKMKSASGMIRIKNIYSPSAVEIMNDSVLLLAPRHYEDHVCPTIPCLGREI